METFYDGDLKDIWDSDLDPTESLKISTETDMHDWFLERDEKDPAVILNDKLISDALLNGTLPIKSEHSYSCLNSDGDSLPDSPRSLQTKIDDMEDECYPAISLKTATSNFRRADPATSIIDPKCLTISSHTPMSISYAPATTVASTVTLTAGVGGRSTNATNSTLAPMLLSSITNSNSSNNTNTIPTSICLSSNDHSNIYSNVNKMASAPMTINLRSPSRSAASEATTTITFTNNSTNTSRHHLQLQPQQSQQQQQQQHYLPQPTISIIPENRHCSSPDSSSSRDGSVSPGICTDIEIDESYIKDEPMSDSSCPPSPVVQRRSAGAATTTAAVMTTTTTTNNGSLSLSMANMAAFTNSDLVFEHKNGCLQLTSASQNLLKTQPLFLGSTTNAQSLIIPKFSIKSETTTATANVTGFVTTPALPAKNNNGGTYGLPLTPPASVPSDNSEGNLTPEHLLSPVSPSSTSVTVTTVAPGAGGSLTPAAAVVGGGATVRRSTSSSSSSSSSSNCLISARSSNSSLHHHHHGSSTRQPIHTPLISSQPKGSTGTLILTEEEKRTLLAEGYPIPQKLPLTKAEEKSLKKIRRKIKNKISAQESRRKKKEYMDQLERRVEILVNENNDYRKRVESLEDSNANLLSQLHKLQTLVNKQNAKKP